MADHLDVWLDGAHAGTLTRARSGDITFTYAPTYQDLRSAPPLSLSLPRHVPTHGPHVVMPWIDNLLPDNDEVRARWAATFGERRPTAFNLLRHMGADCAGAVQILPEGTTPDDDDASAPVAEAEIARHLRELRRDTAAWAFAQHGGRFSLGGAQGKFALARAQDGTWHQPTGRAASTHIFKIGVDGLEHSDLAELVTMRTARALGLTVATTEALCFEDQLAVVVERFDRLAGPRGVRRLHQEDLCQALGLWRTSKYESDGGPGLRELADLVAHADRRPQVREEFARAVAFSFVAAGTDAHAKNYALLHVGSRSALAPQYDLVSAAFLMTPREVWHQGRLATRLGGEYRLKGIALRHLERGAEDLGVDPGWFTETIRRDAAAFADVVRSVVSELPDVLPPEASAAFVDGAARRAADVLGALRR